MKAKGTNAAFSRVEHGGYKTICIATGGKANHTLDLIDIGDSLAEFRSRINETELVRAVAHLSFQARGTAGYLTYLINLYLIRAENAAVYTDREDAIDIDTDGLLDSAISTPYRYRQIGKCFVSPFVYQVDAGPVNQVRSNPVMKHIDLTKEIKEYMRNLQSTSVESTAKESCHILCIAHLDQPMSTVNVYAQCIIEYFWKAIKRPL